MGKRRLKKGVFFPCGKKENGCLGALKGCFFHVEKKENGCFRANLTAVILGIVSQGLSGHVLCSTRDSSYVFCGRCFISRRSRDAKWIVLRPCGGPGDKSWAEGSEKCIADHRAVLEVAVWKIAALRPRWVCSVCVCGDSWWATYSPKRPCEGR